MTAGFGDRVSIDVNVAGFNAKSLHNDSKIPSDMSRTGVYSLSPRQKCRGFILCQFCLKQKHNIQKIEQMDICIKQKYNVHKNRGKWTYA